MCLLFFTNGFQAQHAQLRKQLHLFGNVYLTKNI